MLTQPQTETPAQNLWEEPSPTALLVLADGTVIEGTGLGAHDGQHAWGRSVRQADRGGGVEFPARAPHERPKARMEGTIFQPQKLAGPHDMLGPRRLGTGFAPRIAASPHSAIVHEDNEGMRPFEQSLGEPRRAVERGRDHAQTEWRLRR